MLESFRSKRNSTIVLAVFAIIILVFIFWGAGPTVDNKAADRSVVATVDNEPVLMKDYQGMYKRVWNSYKDKSKGQLTDEMVKSLDLKHKALDILINRVVAFKSAKAEGIKVTQDDVRNNIMQTKVFQKDGSFDQETYVRLLSSNRYKPADYEKEVEVDILISKWQENVVKDVSVGEDEVVKEYEKNRAKIRLDYVTVDARRFINDIKVTDEEGKEFVKTRGAIFMTPVKMNAAYIKLDFNDILKSVNVTDDELKSYYDRHLNEFKLPEQVKARHILVAPDPRNPDKEKARQVAKKKAEDLLELLRSKKANFADLAKKNSDDPGSARTGGDLGAVKRGMMVKPFEDALFALKNNEISGVVETQFGYHIITAYDKREESVAPLKEVSADLKKLLSKQKAWDSARDTVLSLVGPMEAARDINALKNVASAVKGARFYVTGTFLETDKNNEITKSEVLREAALSLKAGEVSRPIQQEGGVFYVIKAIERVDARVPEYEKIADIVKRRIAVEKADQEAARLAKDVLKRLTDGEDFKKLAAKEKLTIKTTPYFNRMEGYIPTIALAVGDRPKFFELDEKKPYYPEPINHMGLNYIFRFKDSVKADMSNFDKDKMLLTYQLKNEKQEKAMEKRLQDIKSGMKIKIYEERL